MTLRLTETQAKRLGVMRSIVCRGCGTQIETHWGKQLYCAVCSEARDLRRKGLTKPAAGAREHRSTGHALGVAVSASSARSIAFSRPTPDLLWTVRFAVPFTYAASKNHIYTSRRAGHVALRGESRGLKDLITLRTREALRDVRVAHNKVWLDFLVQKPNHRGDAINVLDLLSDGIRKALPVDDRWFCVRFLDWEIVKSDPQIFIGIGQDTVDDAHVCSYCGQIKPLDAFDRREGKHLGAGRECRECRSAIRAARKAARSTRANTCRVQVEPMA